MEETGFEMPHFERTALIVNTVENAPLGRGQNIRDAGLSLK